MLATILALMMALGVTTMAWAEGEWTGSGTEADPYMITTEAGLNKLATDVNSGTVYSGKYFKLGASINVTNWTPIGQKGSDNKFAGTFDGNGQTVTRASIIVSIPLSVATPVSSARLRTRLLGI